MLCRPARHPRSSSLGFALRLQSAAGRAGRRARHRAARRARISVEVISQLGKAFNDNRIIAIVWIVLPVIGLLERYGLQQRARGGDRRLPGGDGRAAADPLSALPPDHLGARPASRPPAIRRRCGRWSRRWRWPRPSSSMARSTRTTREQVKAYAAATDNVGLFFGEDIFIAIGSIVLIQQTLEAYGIVLSPLELAVWAIPTAIAAFLIHRPGCCCSTASLARGAAAGGAGHDHASSTSSAWSARCSPPSRCSACSTAPTEALRQCRLLGADRAEPARRRPGSAISPTACSCSASPALAGFG